MLCAASPWQSAQARSALPALRFHRASPSPINSMPGLAVSSRCIAWVSRLMKSKPERRSAGGISAAPASAIENVTTKKVATVPVIASEAKQSSRTVPPFWIASSLRSSQ